MGIALLAHECVTNLRVSSLKRQVAELTKVVAIMADTDTTAIAAIGGLACDCPGRSSGQGAGSANHAIVGFN